MPEVGVKMSLEIIGIGGAKGSGKNTAAKVLVEKYGFREYSLAGPLKKLVSKVFDIPLENLEDPVLKETLFESPIIVDHTVIFQIYEQCSWMLNLDSFKKTKNTILEGMIYKAVRRDTKNTMIPRHIIKSLSNSESSPSFAQSPLPYKSFSTPRELLQFVGTDLIRECINPYFWCKVLDESIKNETKVIVTDVRFFEERQYIQAKKGALIRIDRALSNNGTDSHKSETSLGNDNEYNFLIRNNGSIEDLRERLDVLYRYHKMLTNDEIYVIKES